VRIFLAFYALKSVHVSTKKQEVSNMEIRFNVRGSARKEMAKVIAEIAGGEAVYMGAPTFAYTAGGFIIDADGALTFDDATDSDLVENLLASLRERGFTREDDFDTNDTPESESEEAVAASESADAKKLLAPIVSGKTDGQSTGVLTLELPVKRFSDKMLDNLENLLESKEGLIKKAIGAETLPIVTTDTTVLFPWFKADASSSEIDAYSHLVCGLCAMAERQARVTAKEKPVENEKYAMRCFLLRLGFIGKEYAPARKVLLSHLSGDSSFKHGARRQEKSEAG
jgi:hypothetical protein